MIATDPEELLLADEVEIITRVPVKTLAWWRSTGGGPTFFHLGRRVVYRRGAVMAWLGEQERAERARKTA